MGRKSLTLVEIVVAMLILAFCATGILASFIAARKLTARSKRKLAAINYCRQQAEALKTAVRQDTYDTGLLGCPGGFPCNYGPFNVDLSGIPGTLTYTVANIAVDATTNMRRVVINVNWNEP